MATSELTQHTFSLDAKLDPLTVWQSLTHRGALLLDGNSQHPEARHAYVALSSRLELRIHSNQVTVTHDDNSTEEWTQAPLEALQQVTNQWRMPTKQNGFTGGFVGVIGYGFTRAIEPTLPDLSGDLPDVVLRLCRDVVVFDKDAGTATLWTTDLPGETGAKQRGADIQREIATATHIVPAMEPTELDWQSTMYQAAFEAAVCTMKERIRTGDLFQANIATGFSSPLTADPAALFHALREHNPSPYMALMDFDDHVLVSGSPEQLFAVANGHIRARPIAGTRRRGDDAVEDEAFEQELLTDPKEQAEHTMLVDLLRNDIARVSVPGSVHVPERGSVERYRRVMHLVSRVEGTLLGDAQFTDWLRALFPGGTITGAPKHRACLRIHEAEPSPRGHYTGSAGFLNWDHSESHWNILIRSMVLKNGVVSIHAGSGIVMDSDPAREWQEAGHKAQALLEAATGAGTRKTRGDEGAVTAHGNWSPAIPPGQVDARVLVVDHYDSFVHNLADQCAALGAQVRVVRCDEDLDAATAEYAPTHVVLGPGPGWPADAGNTPTFIAQRWTEIPMLGVCLGHQALAETTGAKVVVASRAVHGEVDQMEHAGGIHEGLPQPFTATRYHSLVVDEATLPDEWRVTARLRDGTIMAMEHNTHPAVGLQYHPESIGTDHGLDILFRFLSESGS